MYKHHMNQNSLRLQSVCKLDKSINEEFEIRESIRIAQEKLRIEREKERIATVYSHLPLELRPSVLVRHVAIGKNTNVNDINIS